MYRVGFIVSHSKQERKLLCCVFYQPFLHTCATGRLNLARKQPASRIWAFRCQHPQHSISAAFGSTFHRLRSTPYSYKRWLFCWASANAAARYPRRPQASKPSPVPRTTTSKPASVRTSNGPSSLFLPICSLRTPFPMWSPRRELPPPPPAGLAFRTMMASLPSRSSTARRVTAPTSRPAPPRRSSEHSWSAPALAQPARRALTPSQTSKPPSATSPLANPTTPRPATAHPEDASSLLASDLALQRLLSESHLLSSATSTTKRSTRHVTTALRLAALGATPAAPARMPMAHRQGIEAKRATRESARRAEARETGAVLARKRGQPRERRPRGKREAEVGGPAVGRWRGGTLVLGRKDVREIRGSEARPPAGRRKRK